MSNPDQTVDIPANRQATQAVFFNMIEHDGKLYVKNHFDICQNNHKGNGHSEAAYQKARHGADKTKRLILEALEGVSGASCEQLESHTGLSHQTCSARISELKRDGRIVKCGTTKTKSGCSAAIYRLAENK